MMELQPQGTVHSVLPSFFVLGAQKAGTTSLDAWLRRQPGIDLPDLKETHFLSDDERYAKGVDWYLGRFAARAPDPRRLRGEVDPDYLSDPRVPGRMARLYGEAHAPPRCVAVLRDPIARAYSHWRMTRRRGLEQRPFAEALRESWLLDERGGGPAGHHDYYGRGRYARHLARYRAALPAAQLMVVTFDELIASGTREETFVRLCSFIGLEGEPTLPDFDAVKNPSGRARSMLLNRLLQRRGLLRRALGRLIPGQDLRLRIGVLLERANTTSVNREEPLEGALPGDVLAAMRADVDELERDLAWNLSLWKARLERFESGERGRA